MKNIKLQPLQRQAIEIIREYPEITIHDFSRRIEKNYQHAASLMSFARKQLGKPAREWPNKVDKTMALIQLGMNVKGQPFRDRLQVKACRASELRHLAKKRLDNGQSPSEDAISWAISSKSESPEKQANSKPDPKPKSRNSTPAVTAEKMTSGAMSVQSVQRQPRDSQDLIRSSGLDPEEWIIASQTVNVWEMGAKHPETGEILVEPLYQTKVRLEPIGGTEGIVQAMNDLIKDLLSAAPSLPVVNYTRISEGHMVEISIPDLHLGKFATELETGENYNPEIAMRLFMEAIQDLIGQARAAYPIERIIFPIGNDFLTADTMGNTTSRGTAQDVSGNFQEHFRQGIDLLRKAVETLRTVAPVDVVIVPGNHDSVASFALGQLLGALYEDCSEVTIHQQSDQARKYINYGSVLLGFAHGHLERAQNLPMLMAVEAAEQWGKARHREIHVGHLHHTRDTHYMGSNEVNGVIVRIIPSLSAADRWHADKGYRSQRAALAFVYHKAEGQRAIFRHAILDRLKINVAKIA